jgi:glyoxylase-like metal-dependent hydrolase (beta-lactamase superfamily II)
LEINAAAKSDLNFVSFSLNKVICGRVGNSPDGPNDNVNQLMALARKLLGTPKNLQLIDGDTDVFGDGSVTLVSTPGHTPGHQSLLVHLKNSGFIILSGDVVHSEENFEKNRVPSLNTNNAESIASMQKIR